MDSVSTSSAVFGPVPSRRLGLSLGVDLFTVKTCTLDCVYCECGPTAARTLARGRFRDAEEVLSQVRSRLQEMERPPDFITLAGSGEPCLHLDLGYMLKELRHMAPSRLAVLTNATLLTGPQVRAELGLADVVVPSLDAVSPRVFARINQPQPGLDPGKIVEGLTAFRKEYAGQLWLEALFVAGVNDQADEVAALAAAVRRIKPDLVQINTVIRPPARDWAQPVTARRLARIAASFPQPAEVSTSTKKAAGSDQGDTAGQVVEMTRRRPCTLEDIGAMAGLRHDETRKMVRTLLVRGRLKQEFFGGRVYYRGVRSS